MRINKNHPLVKEKQKRVSQLKEYVNEYEAVQVAVQMQKIDDNKVIEVWKAPDDKFVVADYKIWEDLYQLGYDREVEATTIYDMASGSLDEIKEV